MNDNDVLICLEDVKKVFLTDEMETHALDGVHLQIRRGEYISIAGRRAAANRLCCRSSGCSIRPATASTS